MAGTTDPHVLAIVLNWNETEETLACTRALLASDWPCLTALVVDNGSEQDITPVLAAELPGVEVIRNDRNHGFAGGMNTGLRRACELGADYALLLNNDTIAEHGMVRALVAAAEARPDAGIVCPLILARDRPEVIVNAGLNCDLRRGYQGPPIGQGEIDRGQFAGIREVDAPAGAAMLVPTRVLDEVGMLDDELFLYGEDVEWAARMRAAGLRTYVAGEARLWHGLSVSSGGAGSPAIAYYLARNSFVVCARHAPMRGPRAFLRAADILLTNLVHQRRSRRPLAGARAVLAGWRDYLRGRLGPAPAGIVASAGESGGAA